jgi:membrane protease YdiL (CAAX protease family)
LDAELPFALEPTPEPGAVPPPARDPVWTGLETAYAVLFAVAAMVVFSFLALFTFGIVSLIVTGTQNPHPTFAVVAISLFGEAAGMAAGVGFFAFLLAHIPGTRFWQAIHWRRLKAGTVGALILGGAALTIAVQLLSRVLPMPSQVPMDKLFTPSTAWLLVVYGVGMAPFFEEFFFRGLLYPSFRATFALGFGYEEQRAWRPLVRVAGVLGLAGLGVWQWRQHTLAPASGMHAGGAIAAAAVLAALALPGAYLGAAGWIAGRLAEWRRPELLAIVLTGTLFGLMHGAQLGWSWAAVLLLALVGVLLTWVRARTGSVMASWLVHSAYNGTLFLMTYFATHGFRHFGPGT